MKMLQFAIYLALVSLQLASMPAAHARPFDLVVINENEEGFVWNVAKSTSGEDTIVVRTCPKNKWITQLAQCTDPVEIGTLPDFRSAARQAVLKWAAENPGKDLKPLTAKDLAVLASNPNAPQLNADLIKLKTDLKEIEEMLVHLPNSVDYLKLRDELKAKIATLNNTLAPLASIDATIRDLTESVIKLIVENPKDGTLNVYARSQMRETFLHQAMLMITPGSPMYSLAYLKIVINQPGKNYSLKRNTSGGKYYLRIFQGTSGSTYAFEDDATALTTLANEVRTLRSSGQW
jgi:hypothetical protein